MLGTPENPTPYPCAVCGQHIKSCPRYHDGICHTIPAELAEHMIKIQQFRTGHTQHLHIDVDYNALPCALKQTHFEWRIRCFDVNIVQKHLANKQKQTVLEIGAWNGWLSHHIARAGHRLTAVDYSAHAEQGLGTITRYDVQWHGIQADLLDLEQFTTPFDVVVMNHGLHLFPDPIAYVQGLQKLVKPGGLLIILCVIVYRDASQRQAHNASLDDTMQREKGQSYFLRATRGYLDSNDKHQLENLGIRLRPYMGMWRANLKARVIPSAPAYYHGWYCPV